MGVATKSGARRLDLVAAFAVLLDADGGAVLLEERHSSSVGGDASFPGVVRRPWGRRGSLGGGGGWRQLGTYDG